MKILGHDYPDDCFYLLERDMWCRAQADGTLRVGVTAFGVSISGDFFMCRPKPAGTVLEQGQTLGVAELNKSVVTLKTPASGTVAAVNPLLADRPEIIQQDCYGQGWLIDLLPSRWQDDLARLAHGPALPAAAQARMRLENQTFPASP